MTHGRILAVHDISCVGRCSLTVALPIISSVGVECSVLPTAVLSTHTGGFTGFTYRDLTEDIEPIKAHWKSLGLTFDAFYTGFLGSFEQIELVKDLVTELSNEKTTVYVDPVMGDSGKLYAIFNMDFPKEMRKLCEKADVLMPNLTELCFMLGLEYKDGPYTKEYIESIFKEAEVFGSDKIIITGVSFEPGKVGAVYKDYVTGETGQVMRPLIEGYYHGTGDVFGSALVGALESGISLEDSVKTAVDFTVSAIKRTKESGADVKYGVDFELCIGDYVRRVDALRKGLDFESVDSDAKIERVSDLAAVIWPEAYDYLDPALIGYMVENFQSFGPMKASIEQGYLYYIVRSGDEDIGYIGMHPEDERMFVSKLYLMKGYRGLGLFGRMLDFVKRVSKEHGLHRIYLTVNRNNLHAIESYKSSGFEIIATVDKPIGEGFEMNDYVMELTF
jgi:pyridoxine kinase